MSVRALRLYYEDIYDKETEFDKIKINFLI